MRGHGGDRLDLVMGRSGTSNLIVDALQELFRKVDVCQQELDNFLLSVLPQPEREKKERSQFFEEILKKYEKYSAAAASSSSSSST